MFKPKMMLLCDFYKISHRPQYPKKTELVLSGWTGRATRIKEINYVVAIGFQGFIKKYLIDYFNEYFFNRPKEEIVEEYVRVIRNCLGEQNPDTEHIEYLHDLGYLPLKIKALPEGTLVPIRVPMFTIENTNPKLFWLTNFIESLMSCESWQIITSATIALEYRRILDEYAMETVGNTEFTKFQGHDFSMRGMGSLETAMLSGAGHLTSFVGTDTIPAIPYLEYYYKGNIEKELIGCSVPASEHSVQCAYGDDDEYVRALIEDVYPSGIVSVVSDGYDFWDVIGRVIPNLKNKIMTRDGKVVIRPDSGDPVKILCGDPNGATELERKGAVEALWDIFGGTLSPRGYKVLDEHIGLIYGDAITLRRCNDICEQLKAKGFASTNVVYGIGSYTYQYNTRDTFGFALKSTLCVIDGKEKQIFKDPKTDNGIKKSQKGAVQVVRSFDGELVLTDGHSLNDHNPKNLLTTIFEDGKLIKETSIGEIRNRLHTNF